MVRIGWSVCLVAVMAAATAAAQEVTKLEPVVVTATKIETPQERLGAAVTVITEEELKTYNYETVGDALRQVPGVEIQRSGSLGKLTDLRIRGSSTSQVQVLVDGVRVKPPTIGTVDLSDISIDQIERIEIVRGPQSTIYGADAIGGVVNIITKRGRGPFSATGSAEGGNYDTHRERVSFGGSYTILDYAVSGSSLESNGQFPNDHSVQRAVTARFGVTLPANGYVSLSARHNRTATGLPVDFTIPTSPFFILDPDTKQETETTVLSLQWNQRPVSWYELNARFGQVWQHLGFEDLFTPGDVAAGNFDAFDSHTHINTKRREAELINSFHFGKWNTLSVGLEHRREAGQSLLTGVVVADDRIALSKKIDVGSIFVQDELRLFDRVFLSGGRRDEDNNTFGKATTHRAGAVILVRETGTKLRGTWGEGFRAPTIFDLFFPGGSNPNLKPERSESWDAGVDQKLWNNRIHLGATYFENKFVDLILFDLITFRPENVAKARTEGVEFTSSIDVLNNLFFTGNYTYTDSKDLATGHPLRRVIPHSYNFGVTWEPVRTLSLFTQVNVVSGQFESEGFPRNRGYHRIDLGGTYRLVEKRGAFPGLDLTARVNNATDARIFEVFGFRALGINALVGMQAKY